MQINWAANLDLDNVVGQEQPLRNRLSEHVDEWYLFDPRFDSALVLADDLSHYGGVGIDLATVLQILNVQFIKANIAIARRQVVLRIQINYIGAFYFKFDIEHFAKDLRFDCVPAFQSLQRVEHRGHRLALRRIGCLMRLHRREFSLLLVMSQRCQALAAVVDVVEVEHSHERFPGHYVRYLLISAHSFHSFEAALGDKESGETEWLRFFVLRV